MRTATQLYINQQRNRFWGKATSEDANEDGNSFGANTSGQDDDPNGPGDALFDDDDQPGLQGLGNLRIHPSDLRDFLDKKDCDLDDDCFYKSFFLFCKDIDLVLLFK